MHQENFTIELAGRAIRGVLHLQDMPAPLVVTCHGLFSSKDSDKFIQIAEAYIRQGFAVARFDFGGCGESTGDIADTTVTGRLQELEAVMQYAAGHENLRKPYGILGSSLGGHVALVYAARHSLGALSVWSTPRDLLSLKNNIPPEDMRKLKDDFFIDAAAYNLPALLAGVAPVQVIHGTEDRIVPCSHAGQIYQALPEPRQLVLLPGADHSITQPLQRHRAIKQSLAWFKHHLA